MAKGKKKSRAQGGNGQPQAPQPQAPQAPEVPQGPPWFVDAAARAEIEEAWTNKVEVEAQAFRLRQEFERQVAKLETRTVRLNGHYETVLAMTAKRMQLPPSIVFNQKVMAFTPEQRAPSVVPSTPPSVGAAAEGSEG
jgi:hypothetical protein